MKSWSQTYPLAQGASVHIQQQSGPVRVVGTAGAEVKLTVSCKDDLDVAEHIEVHQTEQVLGLAVKPKWWGGTPSLKLELEVPQGTACNVESGSGPVEIAATLAPVGIETGSGSIRLTDVGHAEIETGSGSVEARNVNGSISAESGSGTAEFAAINGTLSLEVGSGQVVARQINGDLRIETGSGALRVEDVAGRVDLETGSGGVYVRRVRGSALHVDSGGGPMQLKEIDVAQLEVDTGSGGAEIELLQIYPGGTYSATTGSGGLVVALPPNANVRVRAEAESGRISRAGLNFRVLHESAGEFEGVLNEERAQLTLEAGSGGVRLEPCQRAAAPLSPAGAQVMQSVKDDPALESSDQLRRIVAMVEEGKLTPQEAEELLRALDEEEPA